MALMQGTALASVRQTPLHERSSNHNYAIKVETLRQWMVAMPQDDNVDDTQPAAAQPSRRRVRDLFTIPPPIKRLFDKFPLVTYPANELPLRSPQRGRTLQSAQLPTLYIFATEKDARNDRPSFNPTCLKWQSFLKFNHVVFASVASNNHASPSGALPFLLPSPQSQSSSAEQVAPVASNKLDKWVMAHRSVPDERSNLRYDAYISLLDHRIRNAWLHYLYLEPRNASVMHRLYVEPCSSNPLVSAMTSHQLYSAAEEELSRTARVVDVGNLYEEADRAFGAISSLLGDDQWFFGAEKPGLFDASVFAYTYQLLNEDMEWRTSGLVTSVRKRANLVRHRDLILGRFFPISESDQLDEKSESRGVAAPQDR
ncbi:MAG: hypothetical protein M1837_005423 [Sclerophora amabilis]|nr:MAG: hypothetical protein M1837_005423 [Sclerophora amabilis]